MMEYKKYLAKVAFDQDADIFHGEIINIKDVVTFQGQSVKELKKAFKDSVEDYLEFCAELKQEPDKPFSGNFVCARHGRLLVGASPIRGLIVPTVSLRQGCPS